ncbi:RING-H2 finger protein ATL8-like [Abrus precatorius]|uniref:RING-type E3 ubiquitin transferase n=1 Tax=Abrus precatorius TaxID=3816 RepID=A0A8B8LZL8_ABRPR|nr:RING-H2 finger protein ATL8-like [Abrus precatorius]
MTRTLRILKSADNATAVAAAPPPEAVALESDFVVILAALLCALICVVGLVAVARCAWLRRGSGNGSSPRQALANKGLKKKVLQSLPKFAYVDSNPSKWVATSECAICLADFAAGDEIRVLPQCGHGFHVACIDTWLGSHSSCPSCRQVLAVARCQKCGRFPATGGGVTRTAVSEPELKSREDDNAANNNNNNSGGVSGSSNMEHHHSHQVNIGGFLP